MQNVTGVGRRPGLKPINMSYLLRQSPKRQLELTNYEEDLRGAMKNSRDAMRDFNKKIEASKSPNGNVNVWDNGEPIVTNISSDSGGMRQMFGGFREKGGPVTPGKAYIVGEKKPELFIPDEPGMIVNISRKSVFDAMKPQKSTTYR